MSDYQIASFFVCGAAHTALTLRVDGQKEYALRPGTRICVEGHGRGTYVSKARLEIQDEGFLFSSTPKHIISFDSGEFCETIQLRNTMQCLTLLLSLQDQDGPCSPTRWLSLSEPPPWKVMALSGQESYDKSTRLKISKYSAAGGSKWSGL